MSLVTSYIINLLSKINQKSYYSVHTKGKLVICGGIMIFPMLSVGGPPLIGLWFIIIPGLPPTDITDCIHRWVHFYTFVYISHTNQDEASCCLDNCCSSYSLASLDPSAGYQSGPGYCSWVEPSCEEGIGDLECMFRFKKKIDVSQLNQTTRSWM